MPGLWAKFEANTTDPAIVLARMGAVPRQTEPCGRLTRKGTPCQQTRDAQTVRHGDLVFLSPACGTHLIDDERARRQVVLDAREEAERAANAIATPKCWAWDVDDAVRVAAMSADENAAWNAFVDWHDDRCAICGGRNLANPRVTDHDHHTGFIRGMLCRGCNIREGNSGFPLYVRYRERNPATILGFRQVYTTPFGL
jgi:hypothetical protein